MNSPGKSTVLILVRHASTNFNDKGFVQGSRTDPDLNFKGKLQAQNLSKDLLNYKIDVVYSSDMKRCKETLAPFLKLTKMNVNYTSVLRERDYGIFDGKPEKEYDVWKKEHGIKNNFNISLPDGESFNKDVIPRVKVFLKSILKKESGKTILICSHNVINKAIMLILSDQKAEEYYNKYKFDNASLTVVTISEQKIK
jgi:alpha-ribazole phosphatase/probable phosphoglycerate mutase